MAFIFLASTAGSPGVTTAAVALAMNWAKPTILVEADTAKTSSIIPGALRGQIYHSTGLTEAAVAEQYGTLTAEKLWEQTVELAPGKVLIPGFKSLQGAANATPKFWRSLIEALRPFEADGYDFIIDAGRIHVDDPRIPLLREADSITLIVDSTLPSIASVQPHWQTRDEHKRLTPEWLMSVLSDVGHAGYVDLVVVDPGPATETWPTGDITKFTGLNLAGTIPWDPKGAAVFALGAGNQRGQRTPYARAIGALIHSYENLLTNRTFTTTTEWEGQK